MLKRFKKQVPEPFDPRKEKARLAFEIVKMYHSEKEAVKAQKEFERVFVNKEQPAKMPAVVITEDKLKAIDLVAAVFKRSRSEAKRLIEQNAIEIDGAKISDPFQTIKIKTGLVIKGGRKFAKIKKS